MIGGGEVEVVPGLRDFADFSASQHPFLSRHEVVGRGVVFAVEAAVAGDGEVKQPRQVYQAAPLRRLFVAGRAQVYAGGKRRVGGHVEVVVLAAVDECAGKGAGVLVGVGRAVAS